MAIGNGNGDIWSNAGDTESPAGDKVNEGYITNGELSLSSGDSEVHKFFDGSGAGSIYYKHIVVLGQTWQPTSLGIPAYCVGYGGGKFVVLGQYSTDSLTSTDGLNWTTNSSVLTSRWWFNVHYFNSQFIAAGYYGTGTDRIATSPDGVTWTSRAMPSDKNWRDIAYDGSGTYVAVAGDDQDAIAVSTDNGVTWTLATSPVEATNRIPTSITYANGLFVITCGGTTSLDQERIITSPDGNNWTMRTLDTATHLTVSSIAYANGIFLAAGSGTFQTSSDAITWTAQTRPASSPTTARKLSDTEFIAFGSSNLVEISSDGVSWNSYDVGDTGIFRDYVSGDTAGVLIKGTTSYRTPN